MTAMRILLLAVIASGALKLGGLAAFSLATPDAARAEATPQASGAAAACTVDGHGFRDLLETVREKADELDRREEGLRAREAGLTGLKKAVASEVARLEAVAKTLGVTGAPGAGVSITRVYESMRAEDAAPILDRLDDGTLRTVLGRMRERQVGALLAAMNRERAVAVTKAFAGPAVVTDRAATP
jgi:flagellar motility protein MotE (MotC chaperone)